VEPLAAVDPGETAETETAETLSTRAWWWWLGGITLVGYLIRLLSVLGRPHRVPGGDGAYYFYASKLLVEGKGWINPFIYLEPAHHMVKTAAWPPLFVLIMAVPQVLGIHSYEGARLWLCIFSLLAIILSAYLGREVAGRRVGLVAAAIVAIYPNIWMSVDLGLSEAMTPVLIAWLLWMTYRFWKQPGYRRAIWLGLSMGITLLGRDELGLLALFIIVPLVLSARALSWLDRVKVLAVGAVVSTLVVAPWIGYNLSRFDDPVFISTGLGPTLASANCADTYYGNYAGYWSYQCALSTPIKSNVDESVQATEAQNYAMKFIRKNLHALPKVEVKRLGRAFGFYRPLQVIQLDSSVETRPYRWAMLGLGMYYLLFAGALLGTWVLRRRKVIVYPFWAVGANVVITILIAFGNTRYRTPIEVPLVLLSSVAIVWGADRFSSARRREQPDELVEA
jgi:4-amino-4-deoxy-L-arabinose transferase-like glycosyltransferase